MSWLNRVREDRAAVGRVDHASLRILAGNLSFGFLRMDHSARDGAFRLLLLRSLSDADKDAVAVSGWVTPALPATVTLTENAGSGISASVVVVAG